MEKAALAILRAQRLNPLQKGHTYTVTLRRARDEDRRFGGEKNVIGRREYIMSKPDGAIEFGAKG
jgi:hypothetical protein